MSIYKELDTIILDYVGYAEDGIEYCNKTGQTFPSYECADIDLYNNLIDECTRYLNGDTPLKYLSKDAKICIKNWESLIQSYKETYANLKG